MEMSAITSQKSTSCLSVCTMIPMIITELPTKNAVLPAIILCWTSRSSPPFSLMMNIANRAKEATKKVRRHITKKFGIQKFQGFKSKTENPINTNATMLS